MFKIIRFKRVSSTQDVAKRLFDREEEVAIFALTQTRGRGRRQRAWFSPPGGLYLSVLLFPRIRFNTVPLIAALAVVKTLNGLGFKKAAILWPNDILLGSKKVCGILCERYKDGIVCGIGLNVNIKNFPKNLTNATSLLLESKKMYNLNKILDELLHHIEIFYRQSQNGRLKIGEIYNYLTGIGEMVEVVHKDGIIRGTVFDIDDDWGLLLRDESGVIRKFYYGDIKRLKW
uniref:biotin--[biotin carboxyl-carrier protein] ligase n=1 Tax=candidate division WOR-3 bacterium TaxID=2052148 RepID=A0A7C4X816_UNCW3